ncbi:MAG: WecB/TagA/CpsF family glycosyltransferase [Pseudomonadota bacterium]
MKSESPDFNRKIHCLLGLPFDAVTLDDAVAHIRRAIDQRTPCFLSTPNLNFLIAAQKNTAFRNSVIHSDLSLPDGMPVVWLAKLMGIPIGERVAGSDVFEALRNGSGRQIKVYFFGGPPGIAERAAQQINEEKKGMVCVGFESPGYGSVEDMSSASSIDKVNQSGADFLVVSLGAAKGQAWIEHNLSRLNTPVVSHLGAVVNFVAGGVQRAPRWMQRVGLEWLWRIKEEPNLWRRYWADGTSLVKLLAMDVFPFIWFQSLQRAMRFVSPALQLKADESSGNNVFLVKAFNGQNQTEEPRLKIEKLAVEKADITIDFSKVRFCESRLMGLIVLLIQHKTRTGFRVDLIAPPKTLSDHKTNNAI